MPFESLSCSRCGSGDVQEVKPETYFCNHCDNVFRYVRPSRAGSAGGCEIPAEGLRITGWKRTKLYRHLREHAEAGRAIQVSRGRWRARTTEEPSP
jgi:hypothetical protein